MLLVTIEKLVYGGMGLARTKEGIIFVSDTAPGEKVCVEPFARKGGSVVARPLEILEASPVRRPPPCPLAGACGGCDWLHLSYPAQLSIKKEIVCDCLARIGRIRELPAIDMLSANEFGYRRRAQIKIDEQGNAGFFARGTNGVVPVARCPLLADPVNALLTDLAARRLAISPSVKSIKVVAGDGNTLASFPHLTGRTSRIVSITADNKTFEVRGDGFFQSNAPLLEKLGRWPAAHLHGGRCVDLFGGSGFFSVMLADRFSEGLLIESDARMAESANANFSRNGIRHFSARAGHAESLASLNGKKPIDCLITDPPRPGMALRVREAVAGIKPASILYVSCNPSTQARDLGYFINTAGYRIDRAALFDLYPNTHHIETMVLLSKTG